MRSRNNFQLCTQTNYMGEENTSLRTKVRDLTNTCDFLKELLQNSESNERKLNSAQIDNLYLQLENDKLKFLLEATSPTRTIDSVGDAFYTQIIKYQEVIMDENIQHRRMMEIETEMEKMRKMQKIPLIHIENSFIYLRKKFEIEYMDVIKSLQKQMISEEFLTTRVEILKSQITSLTNDKSRIYGILYESDLPVNSIIEQSEQLRLKLKKIKTNISTFEIKFAPNASSENLVRITGKMYSQINSCETCRKIYNANEIGEIPKVEEEIYDKFSDLPLENVNIQYDKSLSQAEFKKMANTLTKDQFSEFGKFDMKVHHRKLYERLKQSKN